MKYVLMIHSNPQPWGHPTPDFLPEYADQSAEQRAERDAGFGDLLGQLQRDGELLGGEALGDPRTARLYRWDGGTPLVSDGPYSEAKEHLAGFFLLDVESQQRAEEIARRFSGPGETVELRPVMGAGGEDQ
ncbi:YciI family protein [Desertihabitans aurantiacus]|uniref:YciI family protein n=1 Tax=Desertihabitans aurantiacus TaxID=2282477 RepID=UPI000DF82C91|nr:YciI family protein [Desertihabitans aurantiacus]